MSTTVSFSSDDLSISCPHCGEQVESIEVYTGSVVVNGFSSSFVSDSIECASCLNEYTVNLSVDA